MQSAWETEAAPGGGVVFPHQLRLIIWSVERHIGMFVVIASKLEWEELQE